MKTDFCCAVSKTLNAFGVDNIAQYPLSVYGIA